MDRKAGMEASDLTRCILDEEGKVGKRELLAVEQRGAIRGEISDFSICSICAKCAKMVSTTIYLVTSF